MEWLCIEEDGSINVGLIRHMKESTVPNQMSALEILLTDKSVREFKNENTDYKIVGKGSGNFNNFYDCFKYMERISSEQSGAESTGASELLFLCFDFVKVIVAEKFADQGRFAESFENLIRIIPGVIVQWMLQDKSAIEYQIILKYIPDLIERVDVQSAVELCIKVPNSLPQEDVDMNYLCLFKAYSGDFPFRKEFYEACYSKCVIVRDVFVNLFLSQFEADVYSTVNFILVNDWEGVPSAICEYLCANALSRIMSSCGIQEKSSEIVRNIMNLLEDGDCSNTGMDKKVVFNKPIELKELLYKGINNTAYIHCVLISVFKVLDLSVLYNFYKAFISSNLPSKLSGLFVKAFASREISYCDMHFHPKLVSSRYYLAVGDKNLYYGMMKAHSGLREIKIIAKLCMFEKYDQALNCIFELFKGVENRSVSYKKEDLRMLEEEIRYIYKECPGSLPTETTVDKIVDKSANNGQFKPCVEEDPLYSSFYNMLPTQSIELRFSRLLNTIVKSEGNVFSMDTMENDLVSQTLNEIRRELRIISQIPRSSRVFSKLLLYSAMCSEINESLIILKNTKSDSIYGRFRMWMIRHPSMYCEMVDWSYFMKWRMFIFNLAMAHISEGDKKKVSAEMCRLNCLYASKAFREKLYSRASYILNKINSVPFIEVQQNLQKYLLDIECLYKAGEYTTVIMLINSINVNRLSNEDKSRIYHWAAQAFIKLNRKNESEKFGLLSRRMADIVENKKEDAENIRKALINDRSTKEEVGVQNSGNNYSLNNISNSTNANTSDNLKNLYAVKLIDVINELPIKESRVYVIDYLKNGDFTNIDFIQPNKLYFFIPQLKSAEFLYEKNPLLKASVSSDQYFTNLYKHNAEVEKYENLVGAFKAALKECNKNKRDASVDARNHDNIERLKLIATELFTYEIRAQFEHCKSPAILHSFDSEYALPGEYSRLRDEYDKIKVMSYIEDFYCKYDAVRGIFHVRNTDGTLSRVVISPSRDNSTALSQCVQLISATVVGHHLSKLNFGAMAVPMTENVSVHKFARFSLDSAIKIQLFRKKIPMYSIATSYFEMRRNEVDSSKISCFTKSMLRWQKLLRDEILERVISSIDFYMFRNNFINSYSSLMAIQYLLGLNEIALEDTYVERMTGNTSIYFRTEGNRSKGSSKDETSGNIIEPVDKKMYLRPNIGYLLGDEGKNGPLVLIMSRFAEKFNEDEANSRIIEYFFNSQKAAECKLKMAKIIFNGVEEGSNSCELVVSDMADPKRGLSIDIEQLCWL